MMSLLYLAAVPQTLPQALQKTHQAYLLINFYDYWYNLRGYDSMIALKLFFQVHRGRINDLLFRLIYRNHQ